MLLSPGSISSTFENLDLPNVEAMGELSNEFRQYHYLSGLVLSELAGVLDGRCEGREGKRGRGKGRGEGEREDGEEGKEMYVLFGSISIPVLLRKDHAQRSRVHYTMFSSCRSSKLREQAIEVLRDLMASHDSDARYNTPASRGRIASIYLPLLSIIMDNYQHLYKGGDGWEDWSTTFERNTEVRRSVVIKESTDGGWEIETPVGCTCATVCQVLCSYITCFPLPRIPQRVHLSSFLDQLALETSWYALSGCSRTLTVSYWLIGGSLSPSAGEWVM